MRYTHVSFDDTLEYMRMVSKRTCYLNRVEHIFDVDDVEKLFNMTIWYLRVEYRILNAERQL